jgi:hypothetical protein
MEQIQFFRRKKPFRITLGTPAVQGYRRPIGGRRQAIMGSGPLNKELTDEEKSEIQQLFSDQIVPKLKKLDARLGTISCEFAGPRYVKWMIQFRSRGEEFEIVDFEYEEMGAGIDLDL